MEGALAMAAQIASKSPVAVQGTKDNLSFSRFYFHDDDGGNAEVCGNGGHQCMQGCATRWSLGAGLRGNGEKMRKLRGNGERMRT